MNTIALTIGDPNGVGPEIAVKAAAAMANHPHLRLLIVGDIDVVSFYVEKVAPAMSINITPESGTPRSGVINVVPTQSLPRQSFRPGQIDPVAGRATVSYVEQAVDLVRSGRASSIVACPHNETSVNAAGIKFNGYPGLLAELLKLPKDEIFLMLVAGNLRIVHVTLHERLADAIERLSSELIVRAGTVANEALIRMGIAIPRIGMFGINPHAGEEGLFGDDDRKITEPAAMLLRKDGLKIEGPMGADVLLSLRDMDAYIAMYHDQGHIPIKLLAPRHAIALSIGGGVTFSSVGHGSAFNIAGKGIADPEAVVRTIHLVAGLPDGSQKDSS